MKKNYRKLYTYIYLLIFKFKYNKEWKKIYLRKGKKNTKNC